MPVQQVLPNCGLPAEGVPPAVDQVTHFHCEGCDTQYDRNMLRIPQDGRQLCSYCYREEFARCVHCDAEVRLGEDYYSESSEGPFCEGCYMTMFQHCAGCGSEFPINEMRASPLQAGVSYCDDCFFDRFTICSGCERAIHHDDVVYVDNYDGDCYCSDCAPSNEDCDDDEWDVGSRVYGRTFDKIGSKRKFGVELEISGCRNHSGLRDKTPFGVKYDGSLSGGKEFVSPVLQGDEGLDAIANLCAYAREHDWTVDSSCGYHLHIDCSDLNDEQKVAVAVGYAATEKLWARFVSKRRATNNYCGPLPYRAITIKNLSFHGILDMTHTRYLWINWQSYDRHKTLEIRLHSGTVNYDKIANWVIIHTRFVDALAKMVADDVYHLFANKTVEEQFDAVMELVNDDGALRAFYLKRAEKFGQPLDAAVS